MRIEITERSEAFYSELISVAAQIKKIKEHPERKLKDVFKTYIMLWIAEIVLLVLGALMGFFWGFDKTVTIVIVLAVIGIVFSCIYLYILIKTKNSYVKDDKDSFFTIDEKGVALDKPNNLLIQCSFESMDFVRLYDELLAFIPKETGGVIIAIPRKYAEEVLQYIADKDIKVRVYS